MKFSIIVPAFNLETHIGKCLDSLLNQDLETSEYEVLIINDGSTDYTEAKVTEYTKTHSNVFLYNKENGGVSSARNFGIKLAKGEYILFVDGDDWLCNAVIGKIYLNLKNNDLEIARFGYNSVFEDSGDIESTVLKKNHFPISGFEFISNSKTKEFYPWAYVISRDFLLKNKLLFNTGLSFCEDKEFMIRALFFAKRFQNFDFIYYNYNINREGSATAIYSNKHLCDAIKANIMIYKFSISTSISNDYLKLYSIKSLEKSYYKLAAQSLWSNFLFWKTYLLSNEMFLEKIYKDSFKLFILRKNSYIFYLSFYLPRALYHKLKKNKSF